jgi:two-component system chemotaxis response regulator CheB
MAMKKSEFDVVVMVASAGGLRAFTTILKKLPSSFETPIILLQHMAPDMPSHLSKLLAYSTKLTVCEAKDKVCLQPGFVYVNPPGMQITASKTKNIINVDAHTIGMYRPSANVLLRSVADIYAEKVIAVVLSGYGNDGSEGAIEVKRNGGIVIAQNPESSEFTEMPRSILRRKCFNFILPLENIAAALTTLTMIREVRTLFGLHDVSLLAT